jgi:8-oxo-dGTP pyrophosphatase MutT (NUDIX family)
MRFNVRVYGLLIKDDAVLVSDELIVDRWITKFPGGGLEFGEGSVDCLKREFKEELDIDVVVDTHYYTTDFYVKSAFDESQIISIYYKVNALNGSDLLLLPKFPHQNFRWIKVNALSVDCMTLVIDKHVAQLLQTAFKS